VRYLEHMGQVAGKTFVFDTAWHPGPVDMEIDIAVSRVLVFGASVSDIADSIQGLLDD